MLQKQVFNQTEISYQIGLYFFCPKNVYPLVTGIVMENSGKVPTYATHTFHKHATISLKQRQNRTKQY